MWNSFVGLFFGRCIMDFSLPFLALRAVMAYILVIWVHRYQYSLVVKSFYFLVYFFIWPVMLVVLVIATPLANWLTDMIIGSPSKK
jgi:hypothetical protein